MKLKQIAKKKKKQRLQTSELGMGFELNHQSSVIPNEYPNDL